MATVGNASTPREVTRGLLDFPTLALLALMYGLFLGNFYFYDSGWLPLAGHFAVAVVAIHLSFTVWHEAAHGNVSAFRWLNNIIGVLGILPYFAPYFHTRYLHLMHHARLNHADDPNRLYIEGPFRQVFARYKNELAFYSAAMRGAPIAFAEKMSDLLISAITLLIVVAAIVKGAWLEILVLWFLPFLVAKLIQDWYVNHLPHVGLPADRMTGTRVVPIAWLTPLVLCHNYHAVHHLWPQYPWYRYPRLFKSRYYELIANGVPVDASLSPRPRVPPG